MAKTEATVASQIRTASSQPPISSKEWDEIEQRLREQVSSTLIAQELTPADVNRLLAKVDALLTEIFAYHVRARIARQVAEAQLRAAKAEFYLKAKAGALQDESMGKTGNGAGEEARSRGKLVSDEVAKNVAEVKVAKEGWVSRLLEVERRYVFLDDMKGLLEAKREMLITASGMVKLDEQISRGL